MPDQPLPDACPPNPNPNPSKWWLRWWWCWRAALSLLIIVLVMVAGCIIFLLIVFLILHATTIPNVLVDSASSLSLLHEVNTTTIIHGDFILHIKNPSPFVSVKHMHVHAKLNIYYNYQNLMSTNIPIDSFVVGRLKRVSFASSTNSTASLDITPNRKSFTIDVEFEGKRRLGIIGDWWIFAFTLYASCDDMVFTSSSDSWKWTPLGNHQCSIDSFFDYV